MKALTVALFLTMPGLTYSQGVFTNQTHSALQQVINDFPNRFRNIKGNQISEDPQTIDYVSSVQIPGASTAVITKYSSSGDKEVYSWKCVMVSSEDFDEASRKYKELFKQIENSIIKIDDQKPFILNGTYQTPTEDKKFTTSSFYLLPSAQGQLKKLKVEVCLEYYVTEWKLALLVYDQEEEELVMD